MVRLQACFTLLELMLCRNQQLFLRSFYLRFGRLRLGQFYKQTVTKPAEKPSEHFGHRGDLRKTEKAMFII